MLLFGLKTSVVFAMFLFGICERSFVHSWTLRSTSSSRRPQIASNQPFIRGSSFYSVSSRLFCSVSEEGDVSSSEIKRLQKKCEEVEAAIAEVANNIAGEEAELARLNEEYGAEITRVKKEFSRIKERASEESRELTKMAKIDAVKLVLPITDNYYRAKQVYEPLQTDMDEKIMSVYEGIFAQFSSVLEEFGATRVVSLGEPFDFNMMEAIMTAPSTQYNKDIVVTEYQVGYRMGDRCIRPAMVVVSSGPGPSV